MWKIWLPLTLILIPLQSQAAVTITEVAWMGSTESANDEWIELHNDGSAVDVTGWTLSDGMNLAIELDGMLPSGYAVLERTSDDTVAGTAFHIYTGALVNTGATLTLRRTDGQMEDRVAGGADWQSIGGDNTTKETAQYAESGWFTAAATPGAAGNPSLATDPAADTEEAEVTSDTQKESDTTSESSAATRSSRSKSSSAVSLSLPDVSLQLAIDAPQRGYVNQAIDFAVTPSGIGKTLRESLTYAWNFGDTHEAAGKNPTHRFAYPGTYVVTVYGSYKRQEQLTQHEIVILPMQASLTMNQHGDVQVHNDAQYELDVSEYRLVADEEVTFPAHSIILPMQTVTVEQSRLGSTDARMVALYDDTGQLVASHVPAAIDNSSPVNAAAPAPAPPQPAQSPSPRISAAGASDTRVSPATADSSVFAREAEAAPGENVAAVNAATPAGDTFDRRTYALLATVLILVIFGLYLSPRRNET